MRAPKPSDTAPGGKDAENRQKYEHLLNNILELMDALHKHPRGAPKEQPDQAFGPNSSMKVFFIYDFVGRTRTMMRSVDPTLPPASKKTWNECIERCLFAQMLITKDDEKLAMMTGEAMGETDFGDEVREKALNVVSPEIMGSA